MLGRIGESLSGVLCEVRSGGRAAEARDSQVTVMDVCIISGSCSWSVEFVFVVGSRTAAWSLEKSVGELLHSVSSHCWVGTCNSIMFSPR